MTIGLPHVPGFWASYYVSRKDNVVEAINYMLSAHREDFPNTACVGFTIIEGENIVKIYPKVIANDLIVRDFLTGEESER